VDSQMQIPGTSQTFYQGGFHSPAISGGNVVFSGGSWTAQSDGRVGVYLGSAGNLSTVVDNITPAPGGGGNFVSNAWDWPGAAAVDGNVVAFAGRTPLGDGIYRRIGNGPIEVVADTHTPSPAHEGNLS